ncbi:MAG: glycoside hydrolase family 57 protein [bacterium]
MNAPLNVAFLWHMHQPYYKNTETNKFVLPWVRLHGVKDYYDMVSLLDKYPKIKQNFNLVPSLLLQLEEYIAGATDVFQDLSIKPAAELSETERIFVLFNFFMANWETMICPYPRYHELLEKRGENSHPDQLKHTHTAFSVQEIRDLQVWFNLTWIDTDFLVMFPELSIIKQKGENFTEEEKLIVMKRHMDILKLIIPKYKEMAKKGRIEISATPFYHPILPLVFDTETAKVGLPEIPLDFRFKHPEDARAQIKKSVDFFKDRFGMAPAGFWPAEGAVSSETAELFAQQGVNWIATDEQILFESLNMAGTPAMGPDTIYKPYIIKTNGGEINIVFRNHYLSDLVGFSYTSWNPMDAASHFINELYNIKNSLPEGKPYFVSIILDGENAWEYYSNDGKDFLNALYEKLSANKDFNSVTLGEAVAQYSEKPTLSKLWPGSWIDHNFYIWIGHADDRDAWRLLNKTREDLVKWQSENPKETEKLSKAWEEIYVGEGSDWNWWYGDDHSSKNDAEFDNLYRLHLINVYIITGQKIPNELYMPISKAENIFETLPTRFISPVIDGAITSFFEWKGSGIFDLTKEGGAMHKTEKLVKALRYGFDMENFYINIDSGGGEKQGSVVEIKFLEENKTADIRFTMNEKKAITLNMEEEGIQHAWGKIFEAKIPFASMKKLMNKNGEMKFHVYILNNGEVVQRIPEKGIVKIIKPDARFKAYNWIA